MKPVVATAGALWLRAVALVMTVGWEAQPLALAWTAAGAAAFALYVVLWPSCAACAALAAALLPVLFVLATLLGLFFGPAAAVLLAGALGTTVSGASKPLAG